MRKRDCPAPLQPNGQSGPIRASVPVGIRTSVRRTTIVGAPSSMSTQTQPS